MPMKKRKTPSRSPKKAPWSRVSRTKLLDSVFSKWVRISNSGADGMVSCFTCPNRKHWKEMQNGHYVSRSVRISRWNPNNCRPQDYGCNIMHGGQPITFRENLIKEIGLQEVEYLEASRFTIFKPEPSWIEEQIQLYKDKLSAYAL